MQRIVKTVLAVARTRNGRFEAEKERVELSGVIRQISDSFLDRAEDRAVTIGVEGTDEAWAETDSVAFQIIATNLISNAVEHCAKGGTIVVAVKNLNGMSIFEVCNDTSIHETELAPTSKKFVEESRNNRVHAGIGFFLVSSIAEQLGMNFTVSETSEGRFTVQVEIPERFVTD